MKIFFTSATSAVGSELSHRFRHKHQIFYPGKGKKYFDNFIPWEEMTSFKFDFIFILDSPSNSSLIAAPYKNFSRLASQALMIKKNLKRFPETKVLIFSSVSTLGQVPVIEYLNQKTLKPNLYGVAKSTQEQIILLDSPNLSYVILRLPAILMASAVIHFPSRVKDLLSKNLPVKVTNPTSGWNACLHIDDLCFLVEYLILNFSDKQKVIYPHAEGELSFKAVVENMSRFLNSYSKIIIKSVQEEFIGVRKIELPNLTEVRSVEESLKEYCVALKTK